MACLQYNNHFLCFCPCLNGLFNNFSFCRSSEPLPDTSWVTNCILSGKEHHWQGNEPAMMTDSCWQKQHSGLWS